MLFRSYNRYIKIADSEGIDIQVLESNPEHMFIDIKLYTQKITIEITIDKFNELIKLYHASNEKHKIGKFTYTCLRFIRYDAFYEVLDKFTIGDIVYASNSLCATTVYKYGPLYIESRFNSIYYTDNEIDFSQFDPAEQSLSGFMYKNAIHVRESNLNLIENDMVRDAILKDVLDLLLDCAKSICDVEEKIKTLEENKHTMHVMKHYHKNLQSIQWDKDGEDY